MKKKTKIRLIVVTAVLLILTTVTLATVTSAPGPGAIEPWMTLTPQAYLPIIEKPHRSFWGTPQPCTIYPDGSIACP